jgi:hypothetical protein
MPKFVAVQGVRVHRDGKAVDVPLNEPFDFTDEEVADIQAMNPGAIREPINESPAPAKAAAGKAPKQTGDGL